MVIEDSFKSYPAFRPQPEQERVEAAARHLVQARRPVLVAGGGVTASDAGPEVVQLAELLSMPVATSLNGKGNISENHPLSVGVVGTYSRRCANEIVSEADLVFFVGSHTGGQVTHFWQLPKSKTLTIQIDVDPSEIGRNYPADVALLGDAKITLQRLIDALKPKEENTEWTDRVRQVVAQWQTEFAAVQNSDAEPIRPERLCHEITNLLPDDAVLVSDTGHAGMWTAAMVELQSPGQNYLRCAGSLGWAFPASLGAKCALPERPVICFTGDGGFWYHLGEIETAVRSGIHSVTVINNNRSLNQCKPGFDHAYHKQTTGSSNALWVFEDIDFAAFARSMGGFGIRVNRPQDLRSAIEQGLDSGKPAVVDVVSDIDAMAPLAFVPN